MERENSNYALATQPTDRIKLNVGGKLFETTVATLRSGGPDSLLAALSNRPIHDSNPVFIDRDPEIFSVLLSLLRSNCLPSTYRRFTNQELSDEASYYGIETQLKSAMLPIELSGIDASVVSTIRPASDGVVSAFNATDDDDGSVWVAHGGQISVYDWNLAHAGTIRTHLDYITSIRRVLPEIAAVGSEIDSGLHFYNFANGRRVGSAEWTDSSDPRIYKARVTAIADSDNSVFASFDCHHKENCVLSIDKSTLQVASEIGRQNGNSSKTMVAGKLTYLPELNLLVGSSISCGAFGYSGYIRLFDARSGNVVWETNEPGSGRSSRYGDSFADVDVDTAESTLFKVCSKSGDLAMADMRKLSDDPWLYLKDKNPSLSNVGGGVNLVIRCYKKQAFVGRDGELEVWSRVVEEGQRSECGEESYRRNYVDKVEDSSRGIIRKIEGGGNRLFVSRENVEGIEAQKLLTRPTSHSLREIPALDKTSPLSLFLRLIIRLLIGRSKVTMPQSNIFILTDPTSAPLVNSNRVTPYPIEGEYSRDKLMLQRIRSYIAFLEQRLEPYSMRQAQITHYIFTDADVAIVDDLGRIFKDYPNFHLALTFRNNKEQPLNSGFIAVRGTYDGIQRAKVFLQEVLKVYSSKYMKAC